MSSVKFFPIHWFEDESWRFVQVVGRLENGHSIYLRVDFQPFFTVRYDEDVQEDQEFLIHHCFFCEIRQLSENPSIFRMYTTDKSTYIKALSFYEENGSGKIIDKAQSIKSKFFLHYNLSPGSWQMASNLKTLLFNITEGKNVSTADLEYHTNTIVSMNNYASPIPKQVCAFYRVFFEGTTSISLLVSSGSNIYCDLTYQVADKNSTEQNEGHVVVSAEKEKEIFELFFRALEYFRPDKLIGYGNDMDHIAKRVRKLRVKIPRMSKILSFRPYFESCDDIWTLNIPGTLQIDLKQVFKRLLPYIPQYDLDSISQYILGRTGEKNAKILYELWTVEDYLNETANFWIIDVESVFTTSWDKLFDDLVRHLSFNIPEKKYYIGKAINTKPLPGIYQNIRIYSLSGLYLNIIGKRKDEFTQKIVNYFRRSDYSIIPFRSGHFPVEYKTVFQNVNPNYIWIKDEIMATTEEIKQYELYEKFPFYIVSQNSSILISPSGVLLRKGFDKFVRPPFFLIQKYVDYLIEYLQDHQDIQNFIYPHLETTLEDFVLTTKITMKDFFEKSEDKKHIINQLLEINHPFVTPCQEICYIKTTKGVVVEQIYSKDPSQYIPHIDKKYYTDILQETLNSLIP